MGVVPGLGATNAALISCYFAPAWGFGAIRELTSRLAGLDDRSHADLVVFLGDIFGLGPDGLMRVSGALASVKLVLAAGFLAYLIEFVRDLGVRREPAGQTLDLVLLAGLAAILFWWLPASALHDAASIRVHATEFLLVTGALLVVVIERQLVDVRPSVPVQALGSEPATLSGAGMVAAP
jgi:hypothetical protein